MRSVELVLKSIRPFGLDRMKLAERGWRILDDKDERRLLSEGLSKRYERNYDPIIRRDDSDEIVALAGTELDEQTGRVPVAWIEDFNGPGWELIKYYEDIRDWYRDVGV